jgi:hypothetical protein
VLSFTPPEVEALAQGPRPWQTSEERQCPACGAPRIRSFLQHWSRNGRPILIGYVWCANCRRFHGSTGAMPSGLEFEDPFDTAAKLAWGSKGDDFFRVLDQAWDSGLLPQRYLSTPK